EGGAGNDYIYVEGGEGPDTIDGGDGNDYLYLDYSALTVGQNIDLRSGNATDGSVWGNLEGFTFYAGTGGDTARGGVDADYMYGASGADFFDGGAGADYLQGRQGNDTLAGGDGNDYLSGEEGNDRLLGGAGNDGLYAQKGKGQDTLDGGAGTDTAYLYDWVASDFRIDRQADGSVLLTDINLSDGDDGVFTLRSIEWVYFSGSSVQLGTDDSGNDEVDLSGPGGGTAAGGDGDDVYVVDDPNDVPVERPGEGIDTVRASLSWTLGPSFEVLELSGTGNLKGTGNTAANLLRGNTGNNTLDGAAGVDTMEGAAGNDTYIVDDPNDVVVERTGTNPGGGLTGLDWQSSGGDEDPASIGDVADALRSNASSYALPTGVESATLLAGAGNGALSGNADA
ncbi:MAG: calcium-binding protein, partial [Gammaproteobacteria bacterium]